MAMLALKVLGVSYGVHVLAATAHNALCIPHSVWDIVRSLVSTASPVCSALLSTMQVTQGNFGTILAGIVLLRPGGSPPG